MKMDVNDYTMQLIVPYIRAIGEERIEKNVKVYLLIWKCLYFLV